MSQKDIDNIKKTFNESVKWGQDGINKAEQSLDASIKEAATCFRETLSFGLNQASIATSRAGVRSVHKTAFI
jgi:hypothetical protein